MTRARLFGGVPTVLMTLLVGCSVGSSNPVEPMLPVDRTALAPNARVATTGPAITETVRRGTIRDTLSVPGKVAPAVSADVLSGTGGTVTALNVHPGQIVKKDDVLAELTIDPNVLDAARSRAAAADLALETQLARVEDLRTGAGPDALASARAEVVKAKTELDKAQLGREALKTESARAEQARAAAQDAADRQATLADIAVTQADDELTLAKSELVRAQTPVTEKSLASTDPLVRAQAQAQAQALAQADADLATAASAQRTAERKVQEVALSLQDAQSKPNERKASLDLRAAQAQLARDDDDLKTAQAEADQHDSTKDPTGVIAAAAVDKIHGAARNFELAQEAVARLLDEVQAAKAADQRATQLAQLAVDQAQDDVAAARAAQQRAQQTSSRVASDAKNPIPVQSSTAQGSATLADPVEAAQAKVRSAERQVQIAQLKRDEAHAAQATSQTADDSKSRLADLDVQAADAGFQAAQAKLAELARGPATASLDREQRRADLLRDEADAAHQALQPVQPLRASFDGVVSSVNVQLGQITDNRTSVARLMASGGLTVIASASERDVPYLTPDGQVDLTFPGLGDAIGSGTIAEIGASATPPIAGNAPDQVTYPVRINLKSAPQNLKLGMTAMLNVELGQANDVLYVPNAALRKLDGYDILTLVTAGGSLKDVAVQVAGTYGTNVAISSGVQEGDIVAVITTPVAPATTASTQKP